MKERLVNIICVLSVIFVIWCIVVIGTAYENHKLCLNGAVEYCIAEDFK